jgi:hypothetical protein
MSEKKERKRDKVDRMFHAMRPQSVVDFVKPSAQVMLNMVNPFYIADKINPHAHSVVRLLKPIVKPKEHVNWIRNKFTWKNLQAPLSAVAALVLGGLFSVLSSNANVKLSAVSVISTTTIVMEFGSTERFYVKSALRIIGTVAGAFVGFGLGGVGITIHDYTLTQVYLLGMVALGGLVTFIGMKVFEGTGHAFMMFGFTMFSVLYSYTWASALSTMLSAFAGVAVSILTILLFQFPKTMDLLAQTHRNAVENLFTLARFAIESDPRSIDDFEDCSGTVRSALASTSASYEVYYQWRQWTRRSVIHNFDSLSTATRPLFYVIYSMYWGLVQSPAASGYGGQFFFCNNLAVYDKYFRSTRMSLEGAMMAIQGSLTRILVQDPDDSCHPEQHMEMIVTRHLWIGCMKNIHMLKELYLAHKDECFATFSQHWSVCEYLHQLITLTIAITAYVHAIAEIFLPKIAEHIYPMLEDICENLAQIRNEGSMRAADHFGGIGPDRPYSKGDSNLSTHANSYQSSSSFSRSIYEQPHSFMGNSFTMRSGQSRMPYFPDIDENESLEGEENDAAALEMRADDQDEGEPKSPMGP